MLKNINLSPKLPNVTNNDSIIAKNVVDILFVFIDANIRTDNKMTAFTKGLILSQLPGIRNGSKEYINNMGAVKTKKLLDDIQNQLRNR